MSVAPPNPTYVGPLPHVGGSTNKPIKVIVVHCTAGAEPGVAGAARSTVAYTKRSGVVSSYHYCADAKESVQAVWDSVKAYHCGGLNNNSIGYELSCSLDGEGKGHWDRPDHQAMLAIAAKDIARLCLAYDVPMVRLSPSDLKAGKRGLCGHVDVRSAFPGTTTHWDPGPHFPWGAFVDLVKREASALTAPEPKPELPAPPAPEPPKPTTPPHDPFVVGLLPGRWNAPLKAWLDRHRETRDNGAQIVTLTEGTNAKLVASLQQALRLLGWESYHDPSPGPANIIHTWDADRFEMVGLPWKEKLTDTPIFTKKGFEQPDPYSVGIALRDKVADSVILLVGAHLPLENTARRRKAKEEAVATLKDKAFDYGRQQFPNAVRMFAVDWNRRAHKPTTREWFKQTWPGLYAAWATRNARTQGPDWVAAGTRLVHLEAVVLPRVKGDPLDHTTKVTRWAWR